MRPIALRLHQHGLGQACPITGCTGGGALPGGIGLPDQGSCPPGYAPVAGVNGTRCLNTQTGAEYVPPAQQQTTTQESAPAQQPTQNQPTSTQAPTGTSQAPAGGTGGGIPTQNTQPPAGGPPAPSGAQETTQPTGQTPQGSAPAASAAPSPSKDGVGTTLAAAATVGLAAVALTLLK